MATRKTKEDKSGAIVAVAKTLGKAAGKMASLAGVHAERQRTVNGKFVKQHKSRLPRRQKKAQRKSKAESRR